MGGGTECFGLHTPTHGKILNISYSNVQSQNSGDKLNLTIYTLFKKNYPKSLPVCEEGLSGEGAATS